MGLITAVRSQIQVAANRATPSQEGSPRQTPIETIAPVAEPQDANAVVPSGSTAALVTARLAERDESDHPVAEARIAAEAARDAYIRASIVAGVSALPLHGA